MNTVHICAEWTLGCLHGWMQHTLYVSMCNSDSLYCLGATGVYSSCTINSKTKPTGHTQTKETAFTQNAENRGTWKATIHQATFRQFIAYNGCRQLVAWKIKGFMIYHLFAINYPCCYNYLNKYPNWVVEMCWRETLLLQFKVQELISYPRFGTLFWWWLYFDDFPSVS